ncbi:U3 small nucleolar RNA-associated protein 6 homolog [Cylas formicarius]|uniref:U3 small nucleolar RNA-associated protein 6 homolog n=1 Tax=Cylas formicarius TaxID=197179 RepID=UPI00295896A1|nr:U3 small nucleolar RNA-associated protein 6 homolog [Cylas formicarius]
MAEIVQRNLELMTEEISELKRTKLFNERELTAFLKRRREFQFKLNGVSNNLSDFMEAIQYEKHILRELWARRNKRQMLDKKKNIDYKIIKRIKAYYEMALMRYSDDYQLSLTYFKFLKQYKDFHQTATHHVKNIIEKFHFKPEVFRLASAWFVRTNKKEALNVIHRGLALHPDNKSLYLDAFSLELETGEADERLRAYVDSIFKHIHDFTFVVDILGLLEGHHPQTLAVQNAIVSKLFEKHPDDDAVWHVAAQRELRGLPHDGDADDSKKSTKNLIKRCVDKYREGIAALPDDKKPRLWRRLLDTLIDVQKRDPNVANVFKAAALKGALEDARDAGVALDENHYAAWIEVCGEHDESAVLEILRRGTEALPQSGLLWELYLQFYLLKDKVKEADEAFQKAARALGAKAEPVWDMMISYQLLRSSNAAVEALYLRAVDEKQPAELSRAFKPRYLTWLLLQKGVKEARAAYSQMASKRPYCKEMHEEMARIEAMECHEQSLEDWGNCLRLQCEQFGQQDVDIWIERVRFYAENYKGFDVNGKIKEVYEEAQRSLSELLLADFRERFAEVKSMDRLAQC